MNLMSLQVLCRGLIIKKLKFFEKDFTKCSEIETIR